MKGGIALEGKQQEKEFVKVHYDVEKIVSSTDCTGLMPAGIEDEAQAEAYADLGALHPPQIAQKNRKGEKIQ